MAHDRLKWKCRRGLLELDLVLERFLSRDAGALDAAGLDRFSELLELQDHELWDIVNGRSERYDERLGDIVARLRSC